MNTTVDIDMTAKELKAKLSKINEKWEKEKELFCEKMKQNFHEAIKVLFENEPELEKIVFHGWVPSFNDGDPCEFTTDIEDAHVNDYDGYSFCNEDDEEDEDAEYSDEYEGKTKALRERVLKILCEFNEEIVEMIFGSQFRAIITKDKIDVEDYYCGY